MKQILFSTILVAGFSLSCLAADVNTKDDHVQTFATVFPGAQHVRWSVEGEHQKVTFSYNGKGAQAWFDSKGKMIGSIRNVMYADLPVKVMMTIKERFQNAVPFGMTEISREDGTRYKLSVEVKGKRYEALIDSNGGLYQVKRANVSRGVK